MTNIDIGFVIDDGYVKYCSVVIASILKNSKVDETFTFHIINDGSITQESKNKLAQLKHIKDFEIKYYAQNKKLHHEQRNDTRADIPMVTNYRMMISSILKDIDKIIFMDADLIIVDNLSELWNTNIDNYYMACCPSPAGSMDEYQKSLDIPDTFKYCNTGVMLANLKLWRQNHIEDLLFEKEKKYRGIYKYYDQCIFNIAMYDKMLYLNQKFNFRPGIWESPKTLNEFKATSKTPVIIHWASPYKPWNNTNVKYSNEYRKYAKLTPFYKEIYHDLNQKTKKDLINNIFSVTNHIKNNNKYKCIKILGINIKIKDKKYQPLIYPWPLNILLENNYSIDDKQHIITPQNIKFNIDKTTIHTVYTVFNRLDYEFYSNPNIKYTCFDIGMNQVIASLFFAYNKNIEQVYAFEPLLPTYKKAMNNIALNKDLKNKIVTFNFGLGDKNKIVTFNFGLGDKNKIVTIPYSDKFDTCMSVTDDVYELNPVLKDEINTQNLQCEIKNSAEILQPLFNNCSNKIVLKIDTEGAEFDILKSLDENNLLDKIDIIMMEYHFKSPQELENRLVKNNFVVFYTGEHKKKENFGNIYAVRQH